MSAMKARERKLNKRAHCDGAWSEWAGKASLRKNISHDSGSQWLE